MNRSLPRGNRRGSPDPGRASGSGGLVGGVAAAAMRTRNGHCCATSGPRSLARQRHGVLAKAAVTWAGETGIEARSRKTRHGSAGRARRQVTCLSRPSRPPQVASGTGFPGFFHRAAKKRYVNLVEVEPVSTLRRQRFDVEQVAGDHVERLFPDGFRCARCWLLAGGFHGTSINHSGRAGKQEDNRARSKEARRGRSRAGQEGGVRCYELMR